MTNFDFVLQSQQLAQLLRALVNLASNSMHLIALFHHRLQAFLQLKRIFGNEIPIILNALDEIHESKIFTCSLWRIRQRFRLHRRHHRLTLDRLVIAIGRYH